MNDYQKKAFPYEESYMHHGMDLRDYFAAKAMQAYITHYGMGNYGYVAMQAYEMADAMMKAREK